MAIVEYAIRRSSGSNWTNGTNSAHADSHIRMMAGYFFAHVSVNSVKRSLAAGHCRRAVAMGGNTTTDTSPADTSAAAVTGVIAPIATPILEAVTMNGSDVA